MKRNLIIATLVAFACSSIFLLCSCAKRQVVFKKANYPQAEKSFEKSLSLNPKNPYTLFCLGKLYGETDRVGAACVMYKKFIKLNPGATTEGGKPLVDIAKENLRRLGCSDVEGN